MVSRIQEDREDACFVCMREGKTEVHHIFEGCTRSQCDSDRLVAHLCRNCHDKVHSSKGDKLRLDLHKLAQSVYEEQIGTREEFIKHYIKSYL